MSVIKETSKILISRILHSYLGRIFIKFLPISFAVNFPVQQRNKKRQPFFVAITIDTESGYVEKNGRRIWQDLNPYAFQGYYYGLRNWRSLLNKYNIKATFFLSTQCFSAKGETLKRIIKQLKKIDEEGHEMGFHLHPKHDYALQEHLGKKFNYTSAKYYNIQTIKDMFFGGRELMRKHLGDNIANKIASFRWGNWGLSEIAIEALEETGYKIDASACPGIKGHLDDDRFYDWSKAATLLPWRLDKRDYQNINGDSKVLEFPITTFKILGIPFRADPALSDILTKSFNFFYQYTDKMVHPFFFTIISHSSEATTEYGKTTDIIKTMDRFINWTKKYSDIEFVTLGRFLDIVNF